ncbi:hypothetical protein CRENBAI_005787 [Crenichthys baileyi]|uniref:Uncharacterized protein n=1 Tax=Crenichthys baileyi TaxID=28760 RepID=A0AAV9RMY9_9TELE
METPYYCSPACPPSKSTCPVNTERLQDHTAETGTRQRSVLPNSVTVGKTFLPNKPSSTTNSKSNSDLFSIHLHFHPRASMASLLSSSVTILFPLAVPVQVQTHMLAHSINC